MCSWGNGSYDFLLITINTYIFRHACILICPNIYRYAAAAAKSLQSCPTLCNPIDGSPPGSPGAGILQAKTLEWVAISFSNAWKWKVKMKLLSHVRLFTTPWTAAHQAPLSLGFSRQEYWSGVPLPSPCSIWGNWKSHRGPTVSNKCSSKFVLTSFPQPVSICRLPGGSVGKEPTCQSQRHGLVPWVRKDPLEKWMATHSSILAWRISRQVLIY